MPVKNYVMVSIPFKIKLLRGEWARFTWHWALVAAWLQFKK